ncbi:ABC transporter permease [Corynebacterium sp. CCUG 59401]|nr:ABC transporter permease [Corynebacterium pseudogenitalium]
MCAQEVPMELRESINLATSSLRTNKLRSILTLLGIIIGIMAVIIIMTLGRGLQNQVMSGLEDIGASRHVVMIAQTPDEEEAMPEDEFSGGMDMPVDDESDMVSIDELGQIRDHFGERVIGVDISEMVPAETKYGEKTASADINPVLADSLGVRAINVEFGRGVTQQDIDTERPVAVISQELVDAFFDGDAAAALGERIDIEGDSTGVFTVIGVAEAEEESADSFGQMQAYGQIYIPLSSLERVAEPIDSVNMFIVQTTGDEDPAEFRNELQSYMDRQYAHNDNAEAQVIDMESSLEGFTAIFGAISTVIASIGGISLLVGGIGVMNVMLITVTERTREIGVRKALGATRRDIRTQFIVEAVMVCLLGGIIGVLLGGLIGVLSSGLLGFIEGDSYGPVAFPPIGAVVFSLLFSMGIGVFFGFYPANQAAKMQPIDALRYE